MLGILGHGSAREHMCFLRLGAECGDDLRFYQIGANPAVARDPRSVDVTTERHGDIADRIHEDGIEALMVTDAFLLQSDMVDTCISHGIRVLAPSRHAAKIEDRKSLTKRMVSQAGVPTPEGWHVTSAKEAKDLLRANWRDGKRYVVKADALIADAVHRAMVPETLEESERDVDEELDALIAAHVEPALVIERRVDGFETSVHVVWDGESYILLPPVRDYKRVGDGDTGQNTYGAASLACGRGFDPALERQLRERIIEPTLAKLAQEGYAYRGFVYFGVMLLEDGPTLLEINVRPGNPEFVALLGLLNSSFRDLVVHAAEGSLHKVRVEWLEDSYCGAVFAMAAGYPEVMDPDTVPIAGLEEALLTGQVVLEDVAETDDGTLVVAGGRVAASVVVAPSIGKARQAALEALSRIRFEGMHFRSDLGYGIDARLFAADDDAGSASP